jgi:16S rRNA (adenine1518-N6/adenine1519-N6)-dimethyltransferase
MRDETSPPIISPLRSVAALAIAGVRPLKSKGQNFLVQTRIADRIVAAADLTPDDDVIEIGPGLGILSERIARCPIRRLALVELDPRLSERLRAHFEHDTRVSIIARDFLKTDFRELYESPPLKIIGKLPFNAAAAILERLCSHHAAITRMVLMFQREVAERIRARAGTSTYGALSVYTSLYWDVLCHFRVGAGNFHPRPKVDAEVIVFAPRAPLFHPGEERAVLSTIRASFSAPRKTIRNALCGGLRLAPDRAESVLHSARIDPSARAATHSVTDFVCLARSLEPLAHEDRAPDA